MFNFDFITKEDQKKKKKKKHTIHIAQKFLTIHEEY